MPEFAEPFTQKLIRLQLQASAPCSTESIINWVEEQDPRCAHPSGLTRKRILNVLDDLRRRGLVRIWDNTPDAYEWKV